MIIQIINYGVLGVLCLLCFYAWDLIKYYEKATEEYFKQRQADIDMYKGMLIRCDELTQENQELKDEIGDLEEQIGDLKEENKSI